MVLGLFLAFFLLGCSLERNNPYDPHGNNYRTPMTESPHNAGATITVAHSQRDGAYCADEQPDAAHN
jgi:hypothetical protein